jgi:Ser/Thr protein kinase RdoA (MazF antagonist)
MSIVDVSSVPGSAAAGGLAADPALPSLRALLDPNRVAESLADGLGLSGPVEIEECRLERAKYRVGESLRVVYRVKLADGRCTFVSARTAPGDVAGGLAPAVARAVPAGGLWPVWYDTTLNALWWTYPNDRRLRDLAELHAPSPALAELLAGSGTWVDSELVALVPGRSAVLRARDRDGRTLAYAKAYAPDATSVTALAALYNGVAERLRAVGGSSAGGTSASSPRALGWDEERNLLLLEPVAGGSWVGQSAETVQRAMSELGRCIAVLHETRPPAGTSLRRFTRLEPKHLPQAAAVIGSARPDVAAGAKRVVQRLLGAVPTGDRDQVLLHGDCHPGNLLCTDRDVALIDLDQAGVGPAAADVASLVARLRQEELVGELPAASADRLIAAFLAGYGAVRRLPDPALLAWHVSAALVLERALRAVNRVHPRALERIPDLLESAELALSDGVAA